MPKRVRDTAPQSTAVPLVTQAESDRVQREMNEAFKKNVARNRAIQAETKAARLKTREK